MDHLDRHTWHDTILAVESEAGEVWEAADCSHLSIRQQLQACSTRGVCLTQALCVRRILECGEGARQHTAGGIPSSGNSVTPGPLSPLIAVSGPQHQLFWPQAGWRCHALEAVLVGTYLTL